MKLGGWSRLWIIASVLYGLLVVIVTHQSFPTASQINHDWIVEASEFIASAISKAEGRNFEAFKVREALLKKHGTEDTSYLEKIAVSPTDNQRLFSDAIAQVNAKYKTELSELTARQTRHLAIAFACWAAGVLALYLSGWIVGWVYRGFHRDAA